MQVQMDFVPGFCPNCGQEIRIVGAMVSEFFSGEGWTCSGCGCHIQHAYLKPCTDCGCKTVVNYDNGAIDCPNCGYIPAPAEPRVIAAHGDRVGQIGCNTVAPATRDFARQDRRDESRQE